MLARTFQTLQVFRDKLYYSIINPFSIIVQTTREKETTSTFYKLVIEPIVSEPSLVFKNIYIGTAFNANDKEWLQKHNIGVIINTTNEISNFYESSISYYNFPSDDTDSTNLSNYFEESARIIHHYVVFSNVNILVHCYSGKSRSVVLVLYYLITRQYMSFETAVRCIDTYRPQNNINSRLLYQLRESTNNRNILYLSKP
jgi:protein-tyrosine phosphatase